jgi:hypothetical protein
MAGQGEHNYCLNYFTGGDRVNISWTVLKQSSFYLKIYFTQKNKDW